MMEKHHGDSIRIEQMMKGSMYREMIKEILLKSTQELRLEQRFSFQHCTEQKHRTVQG